MICEIIRVSTATNKRTGNDFAICEGLDELKLPVKFFASVNQYDIGDKVELYVDTDYNYKARVSHKKV